MNLSIVRDGDSRKVSTREGRAHTLQTIAVYWERKIKTYGFQETPELLLVKMTFAAQEMAQWGKDIQALEDRIGGFHLVLIQPDLTGRIHAYLLCNREEEGEIRDFVLGTIQSVEETPVDIISPVELLFFYGPHFGDRYGIADAALGALSKKEIPILAASCSGSAVFLVFPVGKANEAKKALSETFQVP